MNKEAFKAGFLAGMAENGMTPSELEAGLEKRAILGALLNALARGAILIPATAGVGLAGTQWLGRAGGQAAHTLTEPTESDIELAKKEEELGEYKRLTEEARIRAIENALRRSQSF